jgi:hypothetical protein
MQVASTSRDALLIRRFSGLLPLLLLLLLMSMIKASPFSRRPVAFCPAAAFHLSLTVLFCCPSSSSKYRFPITGFFPFPSVGKHSIHCRSVTPVYVYVSWTYSDYTHLLMLCPKLVFLSLWVTFSIFLCYCFSSFFTNASNLSPRNHQTDYQGKIL